MKVKIERLPIHVNVESWIKTEGEKVLFEQGLTMTDFISIKLQKEIKKAAKKKLQQQQNEL